MTKEKMMEWLKSNWLETIGAIVLFVVGYYVMDNINDLKKDVRFWQNESARHEKLYKVTATAYESQVVIVDELTIKNEELKQMVEDRDRKALFYANLSFLYKGRLDSIKTVPADTITIVDTIRQMSPGDRIFSRNFNNELYLAGYFNTTEPYLLHITDWSLNFNLDILLSQNKEGVWFHTVDTKNPRLRLTSADVKVSPYPTKLEYFISIGLLSDVKFEKYGASGKIGLKYGTWGGYVGGVIRQEASLELGIIKFGVF